MCGIVGVVARQPSRSAPDAAALIDQLDRAASTIGDDPDGALDLLRAIDAALRGVPGVAAGDADPGLTTAITGRLGALDAAVDAVELSLGSDVGPDDAATVLVTALRDVLWALRHDRTRTIDAVLALAGSGAGIPALSGYLAVQQALSALDRLEVRGRDSAGLHLFVHGHGLDTSDAAIADEVARRSVDPLFQNASVRVDCERGIHCRIFSHVGLCATTPKTASYQHTYFYINFVFTTWCSYLGILFLWLAWHSVSATRCILDALPFRIIRRELWSSGAAS